METEDSFSWITEEALLYFLTGGGLLLVCGFEATLWDVFKVAELGVFLVAEAFCESSVAVSAIVCDRSSGVTRTSPFNPSH